MAQATTTLGENLALGVTELGSLPPWRLISEYLLNAESNDLAVDGSAGSPAVFSYSPTDPYDLIVTRLMLFLQAGSAMSVEKFGDIVALGHGIEIKVDGVLLTTWQDNIDIYTECYNVDTLANVSDAAADTTLHIRWTFYKDLNGPALLVKDTFEAIVNDDLSGLTRFRIKIKGKLVAA